MKLFETVTTYEKSLDDLGYESKPAVGRFYRSGYGGYTKWSYLTITVFNFSLSLLMIILALPLFLAIGLAIKFMDNGPVFYRGTRLGLGKHPFYMYKFRTLPVGTQNQLGEQLVSNRNSSLSAFTKFLRDTRLDELPQLFNVLMGDMDFVGPRPIRPELYTSVHHLIPNYDLRFVVRPGLIGFSQLFTPHSSPKRIRAIIDNRFIHMKRNLSWDFFIVNYTFFVLIKEVIVKGLTLFYRHIVLEKIAGRFSEKRKFERITPHQGKVIFDDDNGQWISPLIDINEAYLKMFTDHNVGSGERSATLVTQIKRKKKNRTKRVHCLVKTYKSYLNMEGSNNYTYIMEYRPKSPFNAYLIDKYFLRKSII